MIRVATHCLAYLVELTLHHTIEERHIFPILAKRMPSFRNDEAHIKSHHGIHEGPLRSLMFKFEVLEFWEWINSAAVLITGLDKLGQLLHKWKVEPSAYSPQEMRESLDSWREVLFKHLDEEVCDRSRSIIRMRMTWYRGQRLTLFVSGERPLGRKHEEVLDPWRNGYSTHVVRACIGPLGISTWSCLLSSL